MILISGTSIPLGELPFNDVMDYTIEQDPNVLNIKLKTVAKSSNCIGVYLHNSHKELPLTEDVLEKTIYFNDDEHLIRLLDNGGKEEDVKDTLEEDLKQQEQEEVTVFEVQDRIKDEVPVFEVPDSKGNLVIEDVDTDFQDTLFSIPIIDNDDADKLNQQLENKNRIIEQKNGLLLDKQKEIDELYRLQEIQLLEMRDVYEKRVDEATKIIETLQKQVEEVGVPEELQWFLKYATYSNSYKAFLKEGLSQEELQRIGKIKSPIYIFASGAGDSLHSMLKNVKELIDNKSNVLVVDFSNDYYLTARYRIQSRDSSMMLKDPNVEVESVIKDVNGLKIVPTTFYNDIGLLGVDWATVMSKLLAYANGKPIILLFNNINSFSVRYTVSKLATIGKLHIFAKSSPPVLSTLLGDIAFIPEGRFKVIAMDYIDIVQPVLEQISKKNEVVAFKDRINWGKININI